jgi:hypothetical protein
MHYLTQTHLLNRFTLKKRSPVSGKRVVSVEKSSMLEVTTHRNFKLKKGYFSIEYLPCWRIIGITVKTTSTS